MSKNIDQNETAADIIAAVSEPDTKPSLKDRVKAKAAAHPRATKIAKIGGLVGVGALALVAINSLGRDDSESEADDVDDELETDMLDDNDDA